MADQPERTDLRDQARGWRLMHNERLRKKFGLRHKACLLDRDDFAQASRMPKYTLDISEKFLVSLLPYDRNLFEVLDGPTLIDSRIG